MFQKKRGSTLLVIRLCMILAMLILPNQQASADNMLSHDYSDYRIHGLSAFSKEHQVKLKTWLKTGIEAQRAALNEYPLTLEIYLYRHKSNQPVPWAHTRRDEQQSLHFYVDSRFTLEQFTTDWTLYHELSHLALPFLGQQYAWFSEGFASFMQYQLMVEAGIMEFPLTQDYQYKIAPHLKWFNTKLPSAVMASRLMDKENYPAAYWGSAWFFIVADQQLQSRHNIRLTQLMATYQGCCRLTDHDIDSLITSLDTLIGDSLFTALLSRFETLPARDVFPEAF